MFGLKITDIESIQETLKKYPEIEQALIYGSRAMGNYKPGSDIDIALKGSQISIDLAWEIASHLNERTPLPYQFDVLAYSTLSNKDLKDHIDRYGKQIYGK